MAVEKFHAEEKGRSHQVPLDLSLVMAHDDLYQQVLALQLHHYSAVTSSVAIHGNGAHTAPPCRLQVTMFLQRAICNGVTYSHGVMHPRSHAKHKGCSLPQSSTEKRTTLPVSFHPIEAATNHSSDTRFHSSTPAHSQSQFPRFGGNHLIVKGKRAQALQASLCPLRSVPLLR